MLHRGFTTYEDSQFCEYSLHYLFLIIVVWLMSFSLYVFRQLVGHLLCLSDKGPRTYTAQADQRGDALLLEGYRMQCQIFFERPKAHTAVLS